MGLSKKEQSNWTKEQKRYFKQHGILPPQPVQTIESPLQILKPTQTSDIDHLTVLCVRFGHRYGREYVERLRNMVSRNLTLPYEFACLTDDLKLIDGVRTIHQSSAGYNKLWWHKVHMFDPDLDIKGRILYFDLDVVIHKNIDHLFVNYQDEFLGIRDFNRKFQPNWRYLNSSVMSWTHGTQNHIYREFKKDTLSAMRLQGDQDWIWKSVRDRITFWPDRWIQSYKWEIRGREQLIDRNGRKGFKTHSDQYPENECCISVFHGDPKPQDIKDRYVVENWK
jgi:hypothetical protein